MVITVISDTHGLHRQITKDLPGGNLIIAAGDISNIGEVSDIKNFCKWFEGLDYDYPIFIAGNHDWGFQHHEKEMESFLEDKAIWYLKDTYELIGEDHLDLTKVYGSPWQPEFYNWAFNLPRNGEQLQNIWNNIPMDTDILITHGPPFGSLDTVKGTTINIGCELLAERIKIVKPKIHVFGHIHTGYGYKFDGDTHFFNAAVLNEKYKYTQKPITFNWDKESNTIEFL